jgi:hypothetical protein
MIRLESLKKVRSLSPILERSTSVELLDLRPIELLAEWGEKIR